MAQGYLAIVLHAHLPFVRHPENERHLEERWLFEALIECYLPLIDVLDRLADENVPVALTMSLTPPLAAMLRDQLLCDRFEHHLARMESLSEKEMVRLYGDEEFAPLATFYREEMARVRAVWERHHRDVVGALRSHWDAGRIELITCSATHCYLPAMLPTPEGVRAQLDLGVRGFEAIVGRRPLGMWLPECAYHPDIDEALAAAGVRFTVLDTHGVTRARPQPPFGEHAPILSPSGVAFFARDQESSRQVWSREEGYPGDAYYRDFYRDIGFDLPEEQLHGEVVGDGNRLMTGIKYYRITGKRIHKQPYIPSAAKNRVWEHAGDFVRNRSMQIGYLARQMGAPNGGVSPIVVSPYDAELFGHWWYEGPLFLEAVFRRLAQDAASDVEPITLRGYLDRYPVATSATPSASSWGAGGYGDVWIGAKSAWVWRHVHHATRYIGWLVDRYGSASGARGQALDQAIRELLLLQSSDWPFILHTGTSTGYALARLQAHTHRLRRLGYLVQSEQIAGEDAKWVGEVSSRDNFFHQLQSDTLRAPFLSD